MRSSGVVGLRSSHRPLHPQRYWLLCWSRWSLSLDTAIVSLEETIELDTTALDALLEFDANLRKRNITIRYARMHDAVRDMLARGGGDDLLRRAN